jgi:hypothetical protein
METHGDFFKELLRRYKTPLKLRSLCFSLLKNASLRIDIKLTESLICISISTSLGKKGKKNLQGVTERMETHGEFFKKILCRYKTPFKFRLIRFSL